MKTIAYMRVSSQKINGHSRQSTGSQRNAIKRHLAAHRTKDVTWLEDYASGKRQDNRPEFQRMMELFRAPNSQYKQLIIFKLDRLGRSAISTMNVISELLSLGVKIVVLTQGFVFDSSAMSQFMVAIFSALAQLESDHASERIKAGLAVAKNNGVRLGKPRNDKKRERIQTLLDKGKSVADISKTLRCTRQNVYAYLKAS